VQQFKMAFANELARVFKKRKTVVFCTIDIVIVLGYGLFHILSRSSGYAVGVVGSIGGLHTIFFMIILPLYIFMEIMDLFTGEMSSLAIRNVLIRPITRTKIYLAKVCAVCGFILAQILFVGILSAVIFVFIGSGVGSAVKIFVSYIITFVPMISLVFVAAFISQIVKNGLLGMLLCIFFLLGAYILEAFVPFASAFLFIRHINLYKMLLTGNIQLYGIFSALFIIAAYIGVSFTAGALLFDKKEF